LKDNICQLSLDIHRAHDCWAEDNSEVQRCHLRVVSVALEGHLPKTYEVVFGMLDHTGQVEN
jgi:hypothetical protein